MSCSCGKNERQRLYCHRPDCAMVRAAEITPPTIDVTPASERDASAPSGSVDIVVHRDGKGRSYRAEGGTPVDLVKDAVRKVLADPYSAEWLPKGDK